MVAESNNGETTGSSSSNSKHHLTQTHSSQHITINTTATITPTNNNNNNNSNKNSESSTATTTPPTSTTPAKSKVSMKMHDVYMTTRLEAYSDTIFSVAATLMVWPLQVTTPLPDDTDLFSYLVSKIPEFLIYLASFVVSANIWTSHVKMFRIIKHVDDFITWINLTCLLFISFIPFSCTLMGRFSDATIAICVASINLLLVGLLQLSMILYASKRSHLLSSIAKRIILGDARQTLIQSFPFIIVPLLSILAIILGFSSPYVAWVFLVLLLFAPLANYVAGRYLRKSEGMHLLLVSDSPFRDGAVDLERLQSFSDGVFSVAATLLVLNVEIPDNNTTANEDLVSVLLGLWPDYLSFVGSFVLVAILWHIHHVIHFHIDRCTTVMVVLNNFSLAFVGFIPFCTSLMTDFARTATAGEIIVVQFASMTIFIAALLQGLIWVYALVFPKTRTTKRRILGVIAETNKDTWFYVSLKVIIVPLNCVLVFVCSFASYSISYIVFHLTLFLTPVLFLVARMSSMGKAGEHYYVEELLEEDSIGEDDNIQAMFFSGKLSSDRTTKSTTTTTTTTAAAAAAAATTATTTTHSKTSKAYKNHANYYTNPQFTINDDNISFHSDDGMTSYSAFQDPVSNSLRKFGSPTKFVDDEFFQDEQHSTGAFFVDDNFVRSTSSSSSNAYQSEAINHSKLRGNNNNNNNNTSTSTSGTQSASSTYSFGAL